MRFHVQLTHCDGGRMHRAAPPGSAFVDCNGCVHECDEVILVRARNCFVHARRFGLVECDRVCVMPASRSSAGTSPVYALRSTSLSTVPSSRVRSA
jgi:hypothetical protein